MWTKHTAPKSNKVERAPYQRRRRENYLNFETKTRDGKEVARYYFVRVPVPATLRKAKRYKSTAVTRYLGTTSEPEAVKLAAAAVVDIREEFARMERQQSLTAEAARQIQAFETWRAHSAMVADPLSEHRAADIDLSKLEEDARAALAKRGLDPSPQNISAAMDALYSGKIGATVLFDRGITPPEPAKQSAAVAPITFPNAIELYKTDPKTKLKASSRNNLDTAVRQLTEFLGGNADEWQSLTRQRIGEFVTVFLPARKSAKAPDGQSPASIKKTVSFLTGVWEWAMMRGYLPEGDKTPWDGQAPSDADQLAWNAKHARKSRRHYEPKETVALFASLPAGTRLGDATRVALLTGVRLEEVAGLDAAQMGDGCDWYKIKDAKSPSGVRIVPLVDQAKAVIKARYEKAHGRGPLFPDAEVRKSTGKRGGSISQEFTRIRREVLGDGTDGELSLHAFRHTWRTMARRAGVDLQSALEMGGWSATRDGDKKRNDAGYDHGHELETYLGFQRKIVAYMRDKGYLG